jgi:serine phosphatase RsbU (regulator of sigma subunit)
MVSDEDESRIFESHSMPYQENDLLYIFTDGYPDQFGGPLGKKFKYRRFRHLLLTIHGMPMKKQRDFLEENIENWRGELEQVDDVLVIGIKITN